MISKTQTKVVDELHQMVQLDGAHPNHTTVNHPNHYNKGNFEVIDIIEDWKLDFHLGNAVKYIARAGHKDPEKEIEDLQKAIWYLKRKINLNK